HSQSARQGNHPSGILQLLQKIEKSGRRETARRLRGVIGSFWLAIAKPDRASSHGHASVVGRYRAMAEKGHQRRGCTAFFERMELPVLELARPRRKAFAAKANIPRRD